MLGCVDVEFYSEIQRKSYVFCIVFRCFILLSLPCFAFVEMNMTDGDDTEHTKLAFAYMEMHTT